MTDPASADVKLLSATDFKNWRDYVESGKGSPRKPQLGWEDIERFLATITTLQSRLALAEAGNAALVEACTPTHEYAGELPTVVEQVCKICNDRTFSGEALVHMPDCPLRNPSTAAQALLTERDDAKADSVRLNNEKMDAIERATTAERERDQLKATQRTLGSIEVCPTCKRDVASLKPGGCGMIGGPIPCPLRPATEPGQKREGV